LPDPRCAEVFALGLSPNPRQVKRVLNIFLLLSRLVEERAGLREAVKPVRLAKVVAIQHAYPELYALLRQDPRYLRDLEAFFRTQAGAERRAGAEGEQPRLPEALQKFSGRPELQRLLCLFEETDARFDGLTPQDIRTNYVALTRQATPLEAPSVRTARLRFEPELVPVPAGPFLMGTSPEQVAAMLKRFDWAKEHQEKGWFKREQPQHQVTLPAFEIGRYPITNAEYAAFIQATGHAAPNHWPGGKVPEELADHPVTYVTWLDAQDYVTWLSAQTGGRYHLPTEAEWEKAARGNDGRLWPWGDDWDPARVNCKPAGPGATTPVGQYSPLGDSPCGAADMAGNVWEWCLTRWQDNYASPPDDDPSGDAPRVLRGGSWYGPNPGFVRCAYRNRNYPVDWYGGSGFRVARSSP
jgi:formylglycine-generating enzyme required for sulfatase activity